MLGLVVGIVLGVFVGAEIVHHEYFPLLLKQEKELNHLLNTQADELGMAVNKLELCEKDYIKQHKNGRDFVTNSLGLKPINPKQEEKTND